MKINISRVKSFPIAGLGLAFASLNRVSPVAGTSAMQEKGIACSLLRFRPRRGRQPTWRAIHHQEQWPDQWGGGHS